MRVFLSWSSPLVGKRVTSPTLDTLPGRLTRVEIDPQSDPRHQETWLRATRPALPRLVLALIDVE